MPHHNHLTPYAFCRTTGDSRRETTHVLPARRLGHIQRMQDIQPWAQRGETLKVLKSKRGLEPEWVQVCGPEGIASKMVLEAGSDSASSLENLNRPQRDHLARPSNGLE